MSFFGFGQNQQQQQGQQQQPQQQPQPQQTAPSFAGFGSAPSGNSGVFGSSTQHVSTPFGSSGFGSGPTGGGFGSTQPGGFGAPKPFGTSTSTGGGIFGGGTATGTGSSTATSGGGFGSFGSNASSTQQTSTPFGGGANAASGGGSIFGGGGAKTGFGTTSTPASGIFSQGAAAGFGTAPTPATTTSAPFGAPASTALGAPTPPSEGTAGTPFQAYQDRDGPNSAMNHYQSISFMQPYQKYTTEEMRVADYMQGRRFGNGSNQPGAFGAATSFGGFGSAPSTGAGFGSVGTTTGTGAATGTGLFGGGSAASAAPFGAPSQPTTGGGFGSASTGTGLFGSKPSTSLFGSTTTSAPQTSGFLSTAGAGFGASGGTTNQGTGGGFGSTTGGAGFGAPATGTGFGVGTGTTTTSSLFGGNQQQQQQPQQQGTTNPFGGFNTAQTQNQPAQGNSLLGGGNANQPKPATGFGAAMNAPGTGTSLFGAPATQQPAQNQSQNPFNTGTSNQSGGLFGAKPFGTTTNTASTGSGGIFGNLGNTGTAAGGTAGGNTLGGPSLFSGLGGNNQNQGGILGGNANQQKTGFGLGTGTTTTNTGAGTSLFGNNAATQQSGCSLFGALGTSQQQTTGNAPPNGMSFLGTPQQNQQQQAPQQTSLSTSIFDNNPFGTSQLFNNLSPNAQNSGPLATPLSSAQKLKRSSILPQYRINPSVSARFVTPQRTGFGFSYSTYGTPGSLSSAPTTPVPVGGGSFGASVGRTLGKSLSMSNLNRNYSHDESVLSPGAFSASGSGSRYNSGSLRKLVINRGIRSDLFSPPPPESAGALPSSEKDYRPPSSSGNRKKVTFDSNAGGPSNGATNGNNTTATSNNNNNSGADGPVLHANGQSATPSAEEQGFLRSSTRANGENDRAMVNGPSSSDAPRGNELAVVFEDASPPRTHETLAPVQKKRSHEDQTVGGYWMSPSKEELKKMPREQLKHLSDFRVGRHGCGFVHFLAPVDLTTVNIDTIPDEIVLIKTRTCAVYPDESLTPEAGKGLNVPSRITLENSWPRGRGGRHHVYDTSGPRLQKHLVRLQRIQDTTFESYDANTGVWIFTVEHFTTYGIDYEEASGIEDSTVGENSSMDFPNTPGASKDNSGQRILSDQTPSGSAQRDVSMMGADDKDGNESSNLDDTFEFRNKKLPPGAFNDRDDEEEEAEWSDEMEEADGEAFFEERSMGSPSEDGVDEPNEVDGQDQTRNLGGSVVVRDQEMAGSYPQLDPTMELYEDSLVTDNVEKDSRTSTPHRSELQSSPDSDMPFQTKLNLEDDWTQHLRRTISPRKQDRQALRFAQDNLLISFSDDQDDGTPQPGLGGRLEERGFNTTMDLMRSLFGQDRAGPETGVAKGLSSRRGSEWPKRKVSGVTQSTESFDESMHELVRPAWGPDGTFLYTMPSKPGMHMSRKGRASNRGNALIENRTMLVSEGKDVRFARLNVNNPTTKALEFFGNRTSCSVVDGVPFARLVPGFAFAHFAALIEGDDPQQVHERLVWRLASCLFDPLDSTYPPGADERTQTYIDNRVRKERLSAFWQSLVRAQAMLQVRKAESKEEEAVAYLCGHEIADACGALLQGRDFRLATLVAEVGGDETMRRDMRDQLNEWRRLKMLSEFSEPVRVIYELLAGNTSVCEGYTGQLEDRAQPIVISARFDLDWRRAFGLRLWYGIQDEEPAQNAVFKYLEDLENHQEGRALPVPWFVEERIRPLWDDAKHEEREDLLWGLLKVFSGCMEGSDRFALEDIIMPENHQLSPVDFRLAWQLYHMLQKLQLADFRPAGVDANGIEIPSPKVDQLTADFAWQLEAGGQWVWALFVSMHVLDSDSRLCAIQGLLARQAGELAEEADDDVFRLLTQKYMVPSKWIWEAKALYARAVTQDHAREVEYLIRASNFEEAHRALVDTVAPQAVIADDMAALGRLLGAFKDVDCIEKWASGGQVYRDYLTLLQLTSGTNAAADGAHGVAADKHLASVVKRLAAALPSWMDNDQDGQARLSFHQRVAAQEMSATLAKIVLGMTKELGNAVSKAQVLSLPLPEDKYLQHTIDMSLDYYWAVMAGGK